MKEWMGVPWLVALVVLGAVAYARQPAPAPPADIAAATPYEKPKGPDNQLTQDFMEAFAKMSPVSDDEVAAWRAANPTSDWTDAQIVKHIKMQKAKAEARKRGFTVP